MARTIAMTPDGDISPTLSLVEGLEAVRQRALQRMHFLRGEWFLEANEGVAYLEAVFTQPALSGVASQVVAAELLKIREVTQVTELEETLDPATRRLRVSARLQTVYGETNVAAEF